MRLTVTDNRSSRASRASPTFPTSTSAARPARRHRAARLPSPHRIAHISISSATSSTAGSCDGAGSGRSARRRRAEAAAQGAQGHVVVYIPGNHDAFGRHFGDAVVRRHRAARRSRARDGRRPRLLVVHGDLFGGVIQCARWLAFVGDRLYLLTLRLNRWLNAARARLGFPYWSLSQYLKHKVKNGVNYISDFEVGACARSTAPRCGRCRLRSQPQGRDPLDRRCPLLQRWRPGRRPYGARGKRRRHAFDPPLEGVRRPRGARGVARFPEYVHARIRVPVDVTYAWLRRFHAPPRR